MTITIENGANNGSFADRIFTVSTNIVQSTLVKARAHSLIKRRLTHHDPYADKNFLMQLEQLGLLRENLWWGPMTLFPRKAQFLLELIEQNPPRRLLEIGSGTSTILFAALAAKHGFSMLSLDNYKGTINYVYSTLEASHCSGNVKLQLCGFIRKTYSNGEKYRWYDAVLDDGEGPYDFVFIDGPMGTLVGRNGAIPEIKSYLTRDHQIFLDDYNRKHEKNCVLEWERHYPGLVVDTFSRCEGIARLKLPDI